MKQTASLTSSIYLVNVAQSLLGQARFLFRKALLTVISSTYRPPMLLIRLTVSGCTFVEPINSPANKAIYLSRNLFWPTLGSLKGDIQNVFHHFKQIVALVVSGFFYRQRSKASPVSTISFLWLHFCFQTALTASHGCINKRAGFSVCRSRANWLEEEMLFTQAYYRIFYFHT